MHHIGIDDGDQTRSRKFARNALLIPFETRNRIDLVRFMVGTHNKNGSPAILDIPIIDDKFGGTKIDIRQNNNRTFIATDVIGKSRVGLDLQVLLISESMRSRYKID